MNKITTKNQKLKDNQAVIDHYLDYPYPTRNPEDEKKRLLQLMGCNIAELNHYLFEGKQDFKNNFRALVAGGGTGDAAIYLGEQLKDTNAEIVYLDFSKNTMKIAQERAKIRKLKNIKWVNDSILNLENLDLGKFDLINCVGVLHHLPDPQIGLNILQKMLKPHGGMDLMVYGQIGRTGLYQVQNIMQMVNKDITNRQEEVHNGWKIINSLPNTNWYKRGEELLGDHKGYGDVGLYDMFLHKQDRAYTIPQLYDFVKKAKLHLADFSYMPTRISLRIENYIQDKDLLELIKSKDIVTQQAICELLCGNVIKHAFWVSNNKNSVASFDNLDNVPFSYQNKKLLAQCYDYVTANRHSLEYGKFIHAAYELNQIGKLNIEIPYNKYTESVLKHLKDGELSIGEIRDNVIKDMKITKEKDSDKEILDAIKGIAILLQDSGILLARHKSVKLPELKLDHQ